MQIGVCLPAYKVGISQLSYESKNLLFQIIHFFLARTCITSVLVLLVTQHEKSTDVHKKYSFRNLEPLTHQIKRKHFFSFDKNIILEY